MPILERSKMQRIDEVVYCHTHTTVHENTVDPYNDGYPTCYGGEYGVAKAQVHRTVYYRARKGDWDEEHDDARP